MPGGALDSGACTFADQVANDNCVADLCGSYPSCCAPGGAWDKICVVNAEGICTPPNAPQKISCACVHSYCTPGVALDPLCDPCVHAVCAIMPSCCSNGGTWDQGCVDATHTQCNIPLGPDCH